MTTQRTAKRKLSNISFEQTGAHVALVSKDQQGPANGHDYALLLKATNFSDDFVEKAAKVRVTMDIEDFLVKFYGLWYEEAEVLARALGFDTAEEDMTEEDAIQTYEDYIQSKVDAIEVFKALHEADSIPEVLSKLDENEYLAMLKSQQVLEKAFKKIEKNQKAVNKESKTIAKAVVDEPQQIASVEKKVEVETTSVVKHSNKEKTMTVETQVIEQEVEVIAKAQFVELEKSMKQQSEMLEKALAQVAEFQAKEKAAIEKARKGEVLAAVKDEAKAEVLFKAVKDASDADFQAVVKALQELTAVAEKSDLFVEKGASGEAEVKKEESAVERLLKSKYSKQAK